jgi:tyrosine-protein phosphatase SIW14
MGLGRPKHTANDARFAPRLSGKRGLENVGRVAPGLYRGARPGRAGLDSLKKLGIRTVINLRHYHGRREAAGCRRRGIDYVRLALHSRSIPKDDDLKRFLAIVTDPTRHPVYFHCWRGKDRTGVMCAAYRVAVDGWPIEAAAAEMHAFGFFKGWRALRSFVDSLPERLRILWPGSVAAKR